MGGKKGGSVYGAQKGIALYIELLVSEYTVVHMVMGSTINKTGIEIYGYVDVGVSLLHLQS